MNYARMSSERLVLYYLAQTRATTIKTASHIEVDCRAFWTPFGVHRSGSTYRRAWQRLLKSGAVPVAGRPVRDHGAHVFKLARPVCKADAVKLGAAVHGGAA